MSIFSFFVALFAGRFLQAQAAPAIYQALPTVTVDHIFPNTMILGNVKQIRIGDDVSVLVSIRNEHTAPLNVTYIIGSINSVKDFRILIQNLTTVAYKSGIPTNAERSFEYRFSTDPRLPARDFNVSLTVFYDDLSDDLTGSHAATFFNQTVQLVEPERLVDTEAFSLYLTLMAIVGVILFAVYNAVKDQPWFKSVFKKATKKAKGSTTKADVGLSDKSDYLVGTSYHLEKKKREKLAKNT